MNEELIYGQENTDLLARKIEPEQWDHINTQKLLEAVRLQLIKRLF